MHACQGQLRCRGQCGWRCMGAFGARWPPGSLARINRKGAVSCGVAFKPPKPHTLGGGSMSSAPTDSLGAHAYACCKHQQVHNTAVCNRHCGGGTSRPRHIIWLVLLVSQTMASTATVDTPVWSNRQLTRIFPLRYMHATHTKHCGCHRGYTHRCRMRCGKMRHHKPWRVLLQSTHGGCSVPPAGVWSKDQTPGKPATHTHLSSQLRAHPTPHTKLWLSQGIHAHCAPGRSGTQWNATC
jgi:hypothetical protein